MELVLAGLAGQRRQRVVLWIKNAEADGAGVHPLELAIHVLLPQEHRVQHRAVLGAQEGHDLQDPPPPAPLRDPEPAGAVHLNVSQRVRSRNLDHHFKRTFIFHVRGSHFPRHFASSDSHFTCISPFSICFGFPYFINFSLHYHWPYMLFCKSAYSTIQAAAAVMTPPVTDQCWECLNRLIKHLHTEWHHIFRIFSSKIHFTDHHCTQIWDFKLIKLLFLHIDKTNFHNHWNESNMRHI
mmetsp:Transcript_15517/g.25275  ORF Transcript_15517/g.25275 Transcript_15517/m.25275 type:complete len:239 (+) Transcript_15517:299-1015(+)